MVKPDWDAPEFSLPEPGWYHVEVSHAELKGPNEKGNTWFAVRLGEVGSNRGIAFDNIFIGGKAAGMGISKMKALGIPPGSDIDANDLNGRRAWVYIVHSKYTRNNGQPGMKTEVDGKASNTHRGYLSEDEYKQKNEGLAPIDNWKKGDDSAPVPDSDIPF